jgi:hypothetical protein
MLPMPSSPVAAELANSRARLRSYQRAVGRRRRLCESAAQITPMPSASRAARSDDSPSAAARPCSCHRPCLCSCRGRSSAPTGSSRSDTTLSALQPTSISTELSQSRADARTNWSPQRRRAHCRTRAADICAWAEVGLRFDPLRERQEPCSLRAGWSADRSLVRSRVGRACGRRSRGCFCRAGGARSVEIDELAIEAERLEVAARQPRGCWVSELC